MFGDSRGWFTETYSMIRMAEYGLECGVFIQDNHSFSAQKGTLRGLHFQNNPKAQTKLVRCTQAVLYLDVAVDIRKGSPQFGQWVAVELSADNYKQLYIPKGFAHAFLALDRQRQRSSIRSMNTIHRNVIEAYDFSDPAYRAFNGGNIMPILSAKDEKAPLLRRL